MYCRNCGTDNKKGAVYCRSCGIELVKPLGRKPKLEYTPPIRERLPIKIKMPYIPVFKILGVVVGILVILVIVLWLNGAIAICGDGVCHQEECKTSCTQDCHVGDCENGLCEVQFGENCVTSADCSCESGQLCKPQRSAAQANGCYRVVLGDGYCDAEFENSENACSDCGCGGAGLYCEENTCVPECGDDICSSKESEESCCLDCSCSAGYNCISNKCVREAAELTINIVPLRQDQSVTYLVATSAIDPLAKITVENNGNEDARNLVLEASFGGYATESHNIGTLAIGEESSFELKPNYSNSILTINAATELTLSVAATYLDDFGVERTAEDSTKINVKGKNAISWNKTYEAAFINPRNPTIRDFAAAATSGLATYQSDWEKEEAARRIFAALYERGMDYVTDPSGDNLDYLQFPEETLARNGGDCDDLAVLFAALLEAVGIESRLIHIPGHLFVGFVGSEDNIAPIETTLVDSGDYEYARERGTTKYRNAITETWVETTSPRKQWDEGVKSVELP